MTDNMTVCPDCGTAFETVGQERETPLQLLHQECPDCGYSVDVGIVNYPDNTYEVVAPAIDVDESCGVSIGAATCGDDPSYRVQSIGEPVVPMCEEHVMAHRLATFDL